MDSESSSLCSSCYDLLQDNNRIDNQLPGSTTNERTGSASQLNTLKVHKDSCCGFLL